MADDQTLMLAQAATDSDGEAVGVAVKLAAAYKRRVEYLYHTMKLTLTDADAQARGADDEDRHDQRTMDAPPEQVSWWALSRLMERNPDAGAATWERIKAAAREELACGARAAKTMEVGGEPWDRAQFIALRSALVEEWQPRGGLEVMLIDTLATAQAGYLYWSNRLHTQAESEGRLEKSDQERQGYWQPPRIGVADALDQSAAMMDRYNRIMLRTLRSLRDLRRYTPSVIVQYANQVNLGKQQVNVSRSESDLQLTQE